jgi:hypothetical protein
VQKATRDTSLTGLKDLLRKCEEIVAILDEASRELDDMRWGSGVALGGSPAEAVKVEEVGGVPLNGVRLDEASDLLSKAFKASTSCRADRC